jgi:nucleoside-diphosphate-sugar epimerase
MNYALRKRILVTGGAGFLGSHTCKALARAGYLPTAYDNLVYGHPFGSGFRTALRRRFRKTRSNNVRTSSNRNPT